MNSRFAADSWERLLHSVAEMGGPRACQLGLLLAAASASGAAAQLSFSGVFSDNVVLQRATPTAPKTQAAVYGSGAAPGGTVTVKLSPGADGDDLTEVFATTAGADGSWKALLSPKPAGGDFTLTASAGASGSAALSHVTFGDVWFCARPRRAPFEPLRARADRRCRCARRQRPGAAALPPPQP